MANITPEQAREDFYLYRKSHDDSLGQFLATYHKRWVAANVHGDVTGVTGIIHLVPLLPEEWQGWATSIIPQYIDANLFADSIYADCRGFIATLSHRVLGDGFPPPGPYEMPERQEEENNVEDQPENPIPFVFQPVELEPYPSPVVAQDPGSEYSTLDSEPFPVVPSCEVIPYDPYPYVAPIPDPSHPQFDNFMHGFLYPPTKEDEAGPSRPAGDGDDDEEVTSNDGAWNKVAEGKDGNGAD